MSDASAAADGDAPDADESDNDSFTPWDQDAVKLTTLVIGLFALYLLGGYLLG